jgi:hypothetical protein
MNMHQNLRSIGSDGIRPLPIREPLSTSGGIRLMFWNACRLKAWGTKVDSEG